MRRNELKLGEQPELVILSFSGIDGAGKSTQLANLYLHLVSAGVRVVRLRFWEDTAVFRRAREFFSRAFFKGDQGVGSPEKPIERRDKNVRSWYLTPMRMFFALFDAAHLALIATAARAESVEVVLFDRYIYDEFVNLPLNNTLVRIYCRLLLFLLPKPQVAFLLDADPQTARRRKPEYPLSFLEENRAGYLAMAKLAKMKIIPPSSPSSVQEEVAQALVNELPLSVLSRVLHSRTLPVAPPLAAMPRRFGGDETFDEPEQNQRFIHHAHPTSG